MSSQVDNGAQRLIGNVKNGRVSIAGLKAKVLSAYLTYYQTTFLVDDSATVTAGEWVQIEEALVGLTQELSKFEADGVTVRFFNDPTVIKTKSVDELKRTFKTVRPQGLANVGKNLKAIIDEHNRASLSAQKISQKALYDVRPLSIIVLTDGDFTEEPQEVIDRIRPSVQETKTVNTPQDVQRRIGVQFVQIGQGAEETQALNELDKALGDDDMIDTVRYNKSLSTELLYKILLGGVYDKLDEIESTVGSGGSGSGANTGAGNSGVKDPHNKLPHSTGGSYPSALAKHEHAIWIPAGFRADISGQANAWLRQRATIFTNPSLPSFPKILEGQGEGVALNGGTIRISKGDTWVVVSTEYALPAGRITRWVPAANKLVSKMNGVHKIGSDDGGVSGNDPDGDFNDAIITINITEDKE